MHLLKAMPILLEEEILSTFFEINLELNGMTDVELQLVNLFKKYFAKHGSMEVKVCLYFITRIRPTMVMLSY